MKIQFVVYQDSALLKEYGLKLTDVYQLAPYIQLDASLLGGEAYAVIVEHGELILIIPVIKKVIPQNICSDRVYYDFSSPYGYPGYISNQNPTEKELTDIFYSLKKYSEQHNIVSLFLRLHPVFNLDSWPQLDGLNKITHGQTVFVDLNKEIELIKKSYSTNHKRDIKRLRQQGFETSINEWVYMPEFIAAYTDTMSLASAKPYYFFKQQYFDSLRKIPGTELHLIIAKNAAGEVASGALFFETGGIVQYHLGGTYNHHRQSAASKLIFDTAIDYFKARGNRLLHLGGGYGSTEDALFRFKSGFSPARLYFSTLRMVTHETAYSLLVKDLQKTLDPASTYFPLYRA